MLLKHEVCACVCQSRGGEPSKGACNPFLSTRYFGLQRDISLLDPKSAHERIHTINVYYADNFNIKGLYVYHLIRSITFSI